MGVKVGGIKRAWRLEVCSVLRGFKFRCVFFLFFLRIKYKSGNGGCCWRGRQVRPKEAVGTMFGGLEPL